MSDSFEKLGKLGAELKFTEQKKSKLILQFFDNTVENMPVIDENDALQYLFKMDGIENIKNARFKPETGKAVDIILEEIIPYFNGTGKYYLIVDFIHDRNYDFITLRSEAIELARILDEIQNHIGNLNDQIRLLQGLGIIVDPNDIANQLQLRIEEMKAKLRSMWNLLHGRSEEYRFTPTDILNSDKGKSTFELKGLTNIMDFEPNQFYHGFEVHRKVDGMQIAYIKSKTYKVKFKEGGMKTYSNCSQWLAKKLASKIGPVSEIVEVQRR
jgi:hypothetical protein